MRTKLLTILLLVVLSGCSNTIPFGASSNGEKLKVKSDKIIESHRSTEKNCEGTKDEISACLQSAGKEVVRYSYLSSTTKQAEFYKGYKEDTNRRGKNIQYFPVNATTTIAKMYLSDVFGGANNEYEIEVATATPEVFDKETRPSFLDIISLFPVKEVHAATDTSSTNNQDNWIDVLNPNTAYGGDNLVYSLGGESTNRRKILIKFTMPSGSGTISDLKLYSYSNAAATGVIMGTYTITRTNWTESATWNKYDGTNNWTIAGGDISTTTQISSTTLAAAGWYNWPLMGSGATNPISKTWGDTVHIAIIGFTGANNYFIMRTKEYADAGTRPYLEITYSTDAATTPSANIIMFE